MKSQVLLLSVLLIMSGKAATGEECLGHCGKEMLMLPMGGESKPGRKYARDRLVDILHLALDVTPDFRNRTVQGVVKLKFLPIASALQTLTLDSVDLQIDSVSATGAEVTGHQATGEELLVQFANPVPAGSEVTVTVQYRGQPANGLHFRTPELGYPQGDTQVWTQGQAENHRYWFPCYDYPNERFTSEMICHVPEGMEVISNGRLLSKKAGAAGGLVAWHWHQAQPHVNYLIALGAGYFSRLEARAGKVPMALLVPPSEQKQAALAFRDTVPIMEFLQKEIGVPYPWDKYDQVYCHDFLAGGMENTSCSFMAGGLLFPEEVGRLETLHSLDAHEMAHQWFGDLLTCRDWSHLWLNEGFASYYTLLYEEAKNGREGMLAGLHRAAERVVSSGDRRPMVWRDYGEPMQQFDSRAYPRGAWVLHMLRNLLGRELYQKGIRIYIERHRNGIVTTDDLQDVLEEVSGKSLDQFFDQWVHHGGVPELKAEYSWDATGKQAKLVVRQTPKVDQDVLLFRFPLPVRFTVPGANAPDEKIFTVTVSKAEETFYFPLSAQPEMLLLDPDLSLLAKWDFSPPPDLLKRQLKADFESRWRAVQSLASKKDDATVQLLAQTAAGDPHHEIRIEALQALGKTGTPAARTALIAQLTQADERVRSAAVKLVATLYHPEAHAALVQLSRTEANPAILADLVRSFAAWPEVDVLPWLERASYQQMVAVAALQTLRGQNRTSALPAVLQWLNTQSHTLQQRDLGTALEITGYLGRKSGDAAVQTFLAKWLPDHRETVRAAAARSLGLLEDPRSVPALEGLAKVTRDPASKAAAESLTRIEAARTPAAQTQEAWKKVQDLTRRAEEMEKKLDQLENRSKTESGESRK